MCILVVAMPRLVLPTSWPINSFLPYKWFGVRFDSLVEPVTACQPAHATGYFLRVGLLKRHMGQWFPKWVVATVQTPAVHGRELGIRANKLPGALYLVFPFFSKPNCQVSLHLHRVFCLLVACCPLYKHRQDGPSRVHLCLCHWHHVCPPRGFQQRCQYVSPPIWAASHPGLRQRGLTKLITRLSQ